MSFNNDVEMGNADTDGSVSRGIVGAMDTFASNPKAYTMDALFPSNQPISIDEGDARKKERRVKQAMRRTEEKELKRNMAKTMERQTNVENKAAVETKTSSEPIVNYVRPNMIVPGIADLNSVKEYLQQAKDDVERFRAALEEHNRVRRDMRVGRVENGFQARPIVLGKQTKSAIGRTSKLQNPRPGKKAPRNERRARRALENAEDVAMTVNTHSIDGIEINTMSEAQDQDMSLTIFNAQVQNTMPLPPALKSQDQEMDFKITNAQDESSVLATRNPQDGNVALTVTQSQPPGSNSGQGKPGKAAFRTSLKHFKDDVFNEKTLSAVKDVGALENGNNNMQAIRVLRRNLDNILYTFGEQSDQYQNFKFMVEESIAELATKMGFSLEEMDAKDAAVNAKRAAGLAENQKKDIRRAAVSALAEARQHERAAIKTTLENGNEEQKALATARLAELKADSGEDEVRAERNRARRQRKKQRELEKTGQQDDGGVALPLATDKSGDNSTTMSGMQALGGYNDDSDSYDSNSSDVDINEDDEEDLQPGGVALMQDDMEKLNALRTLLGDMNIQTGRV